MAAVSREPVKVVIINTEYVQTDATSFKSVVQKLTGKDSTGPAAAAAATDRRFSTKGTDREKRGRSDVNEVSCTDPVLMRDLSFKEFEKLLKDMPPGNELYRLWAD